jgi:hypothetical protein
MKSVRCLNGTQRQCEAFLIAPSRVELWSNAETARTLAGDIMDITTLLIIVLVIVLLGGGGWYGRGRWF